MLRKTIQRKNVTIGNARVTNLHWMAKNRLLGYRNKELTRIKMQPHISPRSIFLVDSAVYSDFLGYVDASILDTPVSIITFPKIKLRSCSYPSFQGKFRIVQRHYLENGEGIIFKQISPTLKYEDDKKLTILSVELRIAKLIGHHTNIVDYHGLFMKNSECFLVQTFESSLSAKDLFMNKLTVTKEGLAAVLYGICDGMTYMHKKGFLNNNITPANISLRSGCEYYTPVFLSLSMACREKNAKVLTSIQQLRYEDSLHLPQRVRQGLEAPSYSSDRYAVGLFIGNVIGVTKERFHTQLESIHRRCFRMDRGITAGYFFRVISECCMRMGYCN